MAFFKRVGHTYALRYEYTHKHNTLVCFGLSMSSIARLAAGAAGLLVVVSAVVHPVDVDALWQRQTGTGRQASVLN